MEQSQKTLILLPRSLFGQHQFWNGFIYLCVLASKCQENILKILPSPTKSPLSLQCLSGSEVKKVCWFGYLKLSCLSAKNLNLFPPNEREAVMLVSEHPDLGNLGSWEQTLHKGSSVLFLWVVPLRWATRIMNLHHLSWLPASCDPCSSSELLGPSFSLSQAHPNILLNLQNRSELGDMG